MKREQKVLVGLLAAILAGALVLAGCEKTVDGPTNYIPVIQPGVFQPPATAILAPNEATLVAWLADTANVYPEIRYSTPLAGAITVGSGKTLYLGGSQTLTSTARVSVTSGGRLVIHSGTASLSDATAITNSGGSVVVENGGTLSAGTYTLASSYDIVKDVTNRATYAVGGTLSIGIVGLLTNVTEAVGYLGGTGILSVGTLVETVKISEITNAIGGAYRVIISGTSVAIPDETAAGTITIPANLYLASASTTTSFANITGLVINGRLVLGTGSIFTALTSVTVNNINNQLGYIATTGGLDVTLGGATRDIFGSIVNSASLALGNVAQLNSVSFGAYSSLTTGTIAKVNAAITVPADAGFVPGQFNASDPAGAANVTYKAGRRDNSFGSGLNSDIDIVISKKTDTAGNILAGTSLSIPATNVLELFGNTKVTVPAGFDLAIAGTLRLNGNSSGVASLALTSAATVAGKAGGAKITGTGKLVAGKTEITGGWQAVPSNDNTQTVTIASSTTAGQASITGSANSGTALLEAAAGASITQLAGAGNNLTITTVTIELGGTIATSTTVGAINLTESAAAGEGGKITLAAATSIINVQAGATDAGIPLTGAQGAFVIYPTTTTGKITALTINSASGVNIVPGATTTARVNRITGGATSSYLQAYGGTTPGSTPVAINASTSTAP
ncbi:hypothetical protein FACS1894190_17050 [Spirochaetia bacterium]|nr:hypothetical protein FACS1894190_17050 [Spirochaetia bacterium]